MARTSKAILIVTLLLFLLIPLYAQDATPQATQEAGVTINMPAPAAASNDVFSEVVKLALAFLGGVSVTLVAVASFVKGVMNDPVKMMLAERLGNSIPAEMGQKMADSLGEIALFVKNATDHIPEASKPPAEPQGNGLKSAEYNVVPLSNSVVTTGTNTLYTTTMSDTIDPR